MLSAAEIIYKSTPVLTWFLISTVQKSTPAICNVKQSGNNKVCARVSLCVRAGCAQRHKATVTGKGRVVELIDLRLPRVWGLRKQMIHG